MHQQRRSIRLVVRTAREPHRREPKSNMKNSERDRLDGRMKSATEAKQNMLERYKAAAADPERLAQRAKRDEAALVRKTKQEAKAAMLLQEKEALGQQQIADAKREQEQVAARVQTAERVIAQTAAHEAERKAERDRRYAARKNRRS